MDLVSLVIMDLLYFPHLLRLLDYLGLDGLRSVGLHILMYNLLDEWVCCNLPHHCIQLELALIHVLVLLSFSPFLDGPSLYGFSLVYSCCS